MIYKSGATICKCGNVITYINSTNGNYSICKNCNEVNFN